MKCRYTRRTLKAQSLQLVLSSDNRSYHPTFCSFSYAQCSVFKEQFLLLLCCLSLSSALTATFIIYHSAVPNCKCYFSTFNLVFRESIKSLLQARDIMYHIHVHPVNKIKQDFRNIIIFSLIPPFSTNKKPTKGCGPTDIVASQNERRLALHHAVTEL
jgi:hypothetical protein